MVLNVLNCEPVVGVTTPLLVRVTTPPPSIIDISQTPGNMHLAHVRNNKMRYRPASIKYSRRKKDDSDKNRLPTAFGLKMNQVKFYWIPSTPDYLSYFYVVRNVLDITSTTKLLSKTLNYVYLYVSVCF